MEAGAVAIGRNEGRHLTQCIESLSPQASGVVYVDSGSSDGSPRLAASLGAQVSNLDPSVPFTAARARNAGLARLRASWPELSYVQFIDGDCELAPRWIEIASKILTEDPTVAIVCGRRRERRPESSIFNLLCDLEWNTECGDASACGGDALVRVSTFSDVGGFNPEMIAGEEPELCYRIRRAGWRVLRIDEEMSTHDASMERLSQWWKRSARAGYAYAHGCALHLGDGARFRLRECLSIATWGIVLPILTLTSVPLAAWATPVLLLGYALLGLRVLQHRLGRRDTLGAASLYAVFCVFGKFAQTAGLLHFLMDSMLRRRRRLIEYR